MQKKSGAWNMRINHHLPYLQKPRHTLPPHQYTRTRVAETAQRHRHAAWFSINWKFPCVRGRHNNIQRKHWVVVLRQCWLPLPCPKFCTFPLFTSFPFPAGTSFQLSQILVACKPFSCHSPATAAVACIERVEYIIACVPFSSPWNWSGHNLIKSI